MKKSKIFGIILILIVTVACFSYGVLSLLDSKQVISGYITFEPYEHDVLINGEVITAVEKSSDIEEYKIASINNHGLSSYAVADSDTIYPTWKLNEIGINESADDNFIIFKITITNYAKYPIEAEATITNLSEIQNNFTIENIPMNYCYDAKYDESGNLINTNSGEIFIKLTAKGTVSAKSDIKISVKILSTNKTPSAEFSTTSIDSSSVSITYTGSQTEVIIPRTINGKTVTTIAYGCFMNKNVYSVTLPDTITSINGNAFYSCPIKSIILPSSVKNLKDRCFSGCVTLYLISIPSDVTNIEDFAFYGCENLLEFQCPTMITKLNASTFTNCKKLKSLYIPKNVIEISNVAFMNCVGLTSINVSSENTVYDSRNNCNAIMIKSSNTLLLGCRNTIIPSNTKVIGDSAFYGCEKLSSITIPNGVSTIEKYAFYLCKGLNSINIPYSVMKIGNKAFAGSGITSATFVIDTGWQVCTTETGTYTDIAINSVASVNATNLNSTYSSYYWKSIYIPYIEDGYTIALLSDFTRSVRALYQYKGTASKLVIPRFDDYYILNSSNTNCLVDVIIFEGYHNVRLDDCSNLKSIVLPSTGMEIIDNNAFTNCTSLTSITIPSSVKELGKECFKNCTSLTSITIPSSVTKINENAFTGCTFITAKFENSTNWMAGQSTDWDDLMITGLSSTSTANNANMLKSTYSSYIWTNFNYYTNLGYSVAQLSEFDRSGTNLTSYNGSARNLLIPKFDGYNAISGKYASFINISKMVIAPGYVSLSDMFRGNLDQLTYVRLSSTITTLGHDTFYGAGNLTSISLPNSIESIGDRCFEETRLKSVTLPDSVITLGERVFYNSTSLTNLTLSKNLTNIPFWVVSGCTKLTSIIIPASVTYINRWAFENSSITMAQFENPNNWKICSYESGTYKAISGTVPTNTMTATNATLLTSTYKNYYWKRG